MPITSMAMTLVTPPSTLPTALVRRPTEPSSSAPRFWGGPFGTRPSEDAKIISRLNCAVTTCRRSSNCAAMVVPANQNTQPRKPKPIRRTSSSRQPRAIGRKRPSTRTPPSRKTAKIAPPTISSSGWARTMTPTMSNAMPSQTAALASSLRTKGSRNSAGPGRSICGSVVGGFFAISCSAATFRRGRSAAPRTRSADCTRRSSRRARR